ncbi:MAG TPA: non-homologous end-joining DNA ligase [Casimicrobiaceae bacterium]|jgi:bifunctional non-homologous end joining protein LigD|nr:non-homologous end-joining DNA ligase [Casimicrobiaceae bacterium]
MQSPLATYRRKRDFAATPEPGPRVARRKAKGLIFVIQRHQARRLHYDFRLELDGVLKSWAVTREPTGAAGDKRLAVHVEDHPVAYAGFHGDIPAGHYGAGHVEIWDRGTWEPEGDPHDGLRNGHLDFALHGKRLRGRFVLVRMKGRDGDKRDNWLLIPRSDAPARTAAPRARKAAASAPATVAGVAITHPERPLPQVPEATKADLARYYATVADVFLPQIADRPLALIKCPGGDFGNCFFAKHAGDPRRARERPADDPPYLHLATLRAAIEAVQNGAIEFHTWGVRFPRLDRPDRLVLDLDPDGEVEWARFREAAERVRDLLDRLELAWFLKTTGGKGLHFVLPLTRRHSWDEVKTFAAAIARRLAADAPDMFIATASKARRKGLVFVDWLRNTDGATAVAAYSLRARPGLPVSMPIEWRELAQDVRGAYFDWRNVPRRLATRKRDPWAQYDATRQTLRASLLRAL